MEDDQCQYAWEEVPESSGIFSIIPTQATELVIQEPFNNNDGYVEDNFPAEIQEDVGFDIPPVRIANGNPFGSVRSNIPPAPGSNIEHSSVFGGSNISGGSGGSSQKKDGDEQWVKIYSNIPKNEEPQSKTLIISGGPPMQPKSVEINHTPDGRSSHFGGLRQRLFGGLGKKKSKKKKGTQSIRFKDAQGNKYMDTIVEVEKSDSDEGGDRIHRHKDGHSHSSNDSGIGGDMYDASGRKVEGRYITNANAVANRHPPPAKSHPPPVVYAHSKKHRRNEFDDLSLGSIGTYNSDTLNSDSSSISSARRWSKVHSFQHLENVSLKSLRSLDWNSATLTQKKKHGVFPLLQIRLEGVPATRIAQAFTRLYRWVIQGFLYFTSMMV